MSAYATYEARITDADGVVCTFQFRTVGTPAAADVLNLAVAEFGQGTVVVDYGRTILRNKRIGKDTQPRIERVSARVRICA